MNKKTKEVVGHQLTLLAGILLPIILVIGYTKVVPKSTQEQTYSKYEGYVCETISNDCKQVEFEASYDPEIKRYDIKEVYDASRPIGCVKNSRYVNGEYGLLCRHSPDQEWTYEITGHAE